MLRKLVFLLAIVILLSFKTQALPSPLFKSAGRFSAWAAVALNNRVSPISNTIIYNGDAAINQPNADRFAYSGFDVSDSAVIGAGRLYGNLITRCTNQTNCPNTKAGLDNARLLDKAYNDIYTAWDCLWDENPDEVFETTGSPDWSFTFPSVVYPGVYAWADPQVKITNSTVIFDGLNDSTSTWVFQAASLEFQTVNFVFINKANSQNLIWLPDTLDFASPAGIFFYGNIIASYDVQGVDDNNWSLNGRVYSMGGSINFYNTLLRQTQVSTSTLCVPQGPPQAPRPPIPLQPPSPIGPPGSLSTVFDVSLNTMMSVANTSCPPLGSFQGCAVVAQNGLYAPFSLTVLGGAVCLYPSTAIQWSPFSSADGGISVGSALAQNALADAETFYNCAGTGSSGQASLLPIAAITDKYYVDTTQPFLPGSYYLPDTGAPADISAAGTLTLNALGNSTSKWIFHFYGSVQIDSGVSIAFLRGAQTGNVEILVDGNLTINTNVQGQWFARGKSVTLNNGASIMGRLAATRGSVTVTAPGSVIRSVYCGFSLASCTAAPPTMPPPTLPPPPVQAPVPPPVPPPTPAPLAPPVAPPVDPPLPPPVPPPILPPVVPPPLLVVPPNPQCTAFNTAADCALYAGSGIVAWDAVNVTNSAVCVGTNDVEITTQFSASGGITSGTQTTSNAGQDIVSFVRCVLASPGNWTALNVTQGSFSSTIATPTVLTPGLYIVTSGGGGAQVTSTSVPIVFDGLSSFGATWVVRLQANSRILAGTRFVYINGADPSAVLWIADRDVSIGTSVRGAWATIYGNIYTSDNIVIEGRLASVYGTIELGANVTIVADDCTFATACVPAPIAPPV
jgi:hypothetical protein